MSPENLQSYVDWDLAIPLILGIIFATPIFFAYQWASKRFRHLRRQHVDKTSEMRRPMPPVAARRNGLAPEVPGSLAAANAHQEAAAVQLDAADYGIKRLAAELNPMLVIPRSESLDPPAAEPQKPWKDSDTGAAIAA
jgi:hypothetical protein